MPRFLLTANFNIESDSEDEAEDLFEDYLADSTVLNDSKSVAFECIEAVIADDDEEEKSIYDSQADGYSGDGPDATLREDAA